MDKGQAGAAKAQPNVANVRYGVYGNSGSYAGKTVAQVRSELSELWGIPADAKGYAGKQVLEDNYQIQPGDQIEFHRRAGEKGQF